MTRARNSPPAPRKGAPRDRTRRTRRQDCHGDHHFRVTFLPGGSPRPTLQGFRWNSRLLAPVLRQGIPPLPAGTSLYARAGSPLAPQAPCIPASASQLIIFANALRAAGGFGPAGACLGL